VHRREFLLNSIAGAALSNNKIWANDSVGEQAASTPILAQEKQLAPRPPMAWHSWGGAQCTDRLSDAFVRSQVEVMISNGMKAAGYEYVNIDDCWQGPRDAQGRIRPSSRFPDMKALADYVHSKGLKFGLYSSPGPKTCDNHEGSYGHEEQDAESYAAWGVDYLKYDWCSASEVYTPSQIPMAYKKMHDALVRTGRPIVFSLCEYGMDRVWRWGASVGGNLWRTTIDLQDNWYSMSSIGFGQDGLERFAGPGHWNDPDMFIQRTPAGMRIEEYRTQMGLWCLLAAPLIVSTDITRLTPELLAVFTNREVIAVDQDPAGVQGRRVAQEGPLEVWMKPLADGSKAVGLFNRGVDFADYPAHWSKAAGIFYREVDSAPVTVHFRNIGVGEKASVRDLWAHKDLGVFTDKFTAAVPSHGVVMIKILNSF
jgi:alpha-galactosidase